MMNINTTLNKEQQEAVLTNGCSMLIVAGAGTGKTRVIVEKIAHLIARSVGGETIVALTFTNKAADEMRDRIAQRISQNKLPFIGTFHTFCAQLLREHCDAMKLSQSFIIADSEHTRRILKRLMKTYGVQGITPRVLQEAISQLKTTGAVSMTKAVVVAAEELYQKYENELSKARALDFDDLLIKCVALLNKKNIRDEVCSRYTHIFVDEFQDIDVLQGKLLTQLHTKKNVVVAVGDTDQTIYSWRGASIDTMLSFTKKHSPVKTILMTKNYRSTQTILDVANTIIKKNEMRQKKDLFGTRGVGNPVIFIRAEDEENEAEKIAIEIQKLVKKGFSYNDFAILFRANFQARALESQMLTKRVPYRVIGTRFFQRAEIKGILAYLILTRNRQVREALTQAVHIPSRGIGEKTIERMLAGQKHLLSNNLLKKVEQFEATIDYIQENLQKSTAAETIKRLLKKIAYDEYLNLTFSNPQERKREVDELIAFAERFSQLGGMEGVDAVLAEAALSSDQDTLRHHRNGVRLMTVHAAKGLEFPVVFLSGMEEGLFPFITTESAYDKEEERRLCYVAITRAKDLLYCSYAQQRRNYFSKHRTSQASSFLNDIVDEQKHLIIDSESNRILVDETILW